MKFKNYIFDLGGVIADINMQNALDEFRVLGVPEEELNYVSGPAAKLMQEYQLGLLTTEEFCAGIAARCKSSAANPTKSNRDAANPTNKTRDAASPTKLNRGATVPTFQEIADAWNTIIVHIPQRKLDALRALKQKANVYLLSNTNELHWQKCLDLWFNADGGNIAQYFHHTFLSQDLHLEKPNPEIFKQVLREIAALQTRDVANPTNQARDIALQTRDAANPTYQARDIALQTRDAANLTSPTCDTANPTYLTSDAITPTNTVFLDDNKQNADAAISCGISAIHVTPDYDWVTELI